MEDTRRWTLHSALPPALEEYADSEVSESEESLPSVESAGLSVGHGVGEAAVHREGGEAPHISSGAGRSVHDGEPQALQEDVDDGGLVSERLVAVGRGYLCNT